MSMPTDGLPTLLIPLDGSAAAESVLPAAITLTQRLPARVTLLHTIERDAPAQVHGEPHLRREADAAAYLQGVAARLADAGVAVTWHVHEAPVGNVPRNIAAHAAEEPTALIVLSTHEVTDPRAWLMGAVAQGVIRYAAPPVLLLRTGKQQPTAFAPGEVIVALDGEGHGEAAIPGAVGLARALGVPLRLLAVVPTADTLPGDHAAAARLLPSGAAAALDLEAKAVASDLATLTARLRAQEPGLSIVPEIMRGDPAPTIIAAARAHNAVIALATHGRTGLDALWSASIGARIIARAPGPFLLVHPEAGG
ncbi:MAG: universal stress protein [Thermomicrobiales bacterium]